MVRRRGSFNPPEVLCAPPQKKATELEVQAQTKRMHEQDTDPRHTLPGNKCDALKTVKRAISLALAASDLLSNSAQPCPTQPVFKTDWTLVICLRRGSVEGKPKRRKEGQEKD